MWAQKGPVIDCDQLVVEGNPELGFRRNVSALSSLRKLCRVSIPVLGSCSASGIYWAVCLSDLPPKKSEILDRTQWAYRDDACITMPDTFHVFIWNTYKCQCNFITIQPLSVTHGEINGWYLGRQLCLRESTPRTVKIMVTQWANHDLGFSVKWLFCFEGVLLCLFLTTCVKEHLEKICRFKLFVPDFWYLSVFDKLTTHFLNGNIAGGKICLKILPLSF